MNEIELLNDHASGYGIELTQLSLDLFRVYLDELIEWNRKINLTGLTARQKIVNELFLDSLIPSPFLPAKGRLLDVGSGAGFPGMVLKINNPGLHAHLLEPNTKRTRFLKHIIRLLKLENISVLKGRIEKDENILHPDGYDIITSRALSGLPQIIDWCAPHLSKNGVLVGFLGIDADNILRMCQPNLSTHGLILLKKIPYVLPDRDKERITVLLKKEEP
jgi:16S rRNA (guanine527-N7)-methyltransferase